MLRSARVISVQSWKAKVAACRGPGEFTEGEPQECVAPVKSSGSTMRRVLASSRRTAERTCSSTSCRHSVRGLPHASGRLRCRVRPGAGSEGTPGGERRPATASRNRRKGRRTRRPFLFARATHTRNSQHEPTPAPDPLLLATSASAADIDVVREAIRQLPHGRRARNAARMPRRSRTLEWVARVTRRRTPHRRELAGHHLQRNAGRQLGTVGTLHRWLFVLAQAYQTSGQSLYRARNCSRTSTPHWRTRRRLRRDDSPPATGGSGRSASRSTSARHSCSCKVTSINRRSTTSSPRCTCASATPRRARGLVGPTPTGQNLVWSSYTHLCLGLLKNDEPILAAVRDAMA